MKTKRFRQILTPILILVLMALIVTGVICFKNCSLRDPSTPETVTVTFDTGEGSKVEPLSVEKGKTLSNVPTSNLASSTFDGWYYDDDYQKEFEENDKIKKDLTLYAKFSRKYDDMVINEDSQYYEEGCDTLQEITIIAKKGLSKEEFLNSIVIEGITGELPEIDVKINNDEYTLIPGKITDEYTGYEDGKVYAITIPKTYKFKSLDKNIREYTFRIAKDETKKDEYSLNPNIKNIVKTDLVNFQTLSETEQGYLILITKTVFESHNFVLGDIISIDEKCDQDNKPIFDEQTSTVIKITGISVMEPYYLVEGIQAEIEEIFSSLDINTTQVVKASDAIEELDAEEMEREILESQGLKDVTKLLAASFAASPTIKRELNKPSFTENSYAFEDTMKGIEADLFKGVTAKIEFGTGHNPNFDSYLEDDFMVIRFTINFDATIKKKVKIKAELVVTQYLGLSMQGYTDFSLKKSYLRFEYAFNLYSQTDLDLIVLVCSIDEEDEEYTDISKEISDMLKEDSEDEDTNLVKQLQSFLEDESGDIELFRASLIKVSYPVIPLIHLLDVNTSLDFVVKVNFAVGISIDASVLEAVQIGAYGNTKTGEIGSINNKLPGGDQYSLELTACGYLGFKIGFEASLTLSFCGASKFGEVGLAVFVGPYVDMYGFVKMSLSRVGRFNSLPKTVTEEIIGGYYIEIGINVEVELIARSKFFKVKVGSTLLDLKIPLVHFGDKDVLLDVEEKEVETVLMNDASGQDISKMDYKNIIKAQGEYIDITTGDTSTKDITWDKFHLTFSNTAFSYDSSTGSIIYNRQKNNGKYADECYITFYYTGPYLKFTSNSSNIYRRCPAGTIKVIWTDTLKIPAGSAGKTYDIKIEFVVDGEIVEERTQTALAGTTIGHVSTNLNSSAYTKGTWNNDPSTTLINSDTTFRYETYRRQMYVSFIWYNETTTKWILEVRPVKLGEIATAPTITDIDKVHFKYWSARKGINNNYQNVSSVGLSNIPTSDDIYRKGYGAGMLASNLDESTAIFHYEDTSYNNVLDAFTDTKLETGYTPYTISMHYYTACYDYDDCAVTYVYPTENKVYEAKVKYGTNFSTTSLYNFLPDDKYVVGYSYYEDLSEPISPNETTEVTNDITLYVIWGYKTFNLIVNYYDDQNDKYVKYKDIEITSEFDLESLLDEADKALVKEEGVTYKLNSWKYISNYHYVQFNVNSTITEDLELSPIYERTFDIEFDPSGGVFHLTGSSEKEKITLSSEDEDGPYYFFLNKYVVKEDNYYNYTLKGWKDTKTGKEYKMWTTTYNEIVSPTTLVPIWEKEEISYKLTVETTYSTLLNGEKFDEYIGGYDGYIEFYNKYKEFIPESFINEEEHSVSTASYAEMKNTLGNVYKIFYIWTAKYDDLTITFDVNGGNELSENTKTTKYGDKVDLAHYSTTKKSDNYGDYVLAGWIDENNNQYNPDDVITIKGNLTLKALWTTNYKDYTITYYVNEEIVATDTYHYQDQITEKERPLDTMKYKFSGWTWYSNESTIDMPEKMPAENLIVKAKTEVVYVIYLVDEIEFAKIPADANTLITIKEKYEKTGYDVTNWQNEEITLTDNKFMMPEENVTFTATTKKAIYQVEYVDLDGKTIGEIEQYEYLSVVTLRSISSEETYEWISDDVEIIANTFTIPAHNVTIRMTEPEISNHVIYIINNEIKGYEYASPGEKVTLKDETTFGTYQGTFSGWYSPETTITNNSFIMKNNIVYIYGYYTSGEVKINLYVNETNSLTLYGSSGTIISPKKTQTNEEIETYALTDDNITISNLIIDFYDLNIKGFKVNDEFTETVLIDEKTKEIDIFIVYNTSYKATYYIVNNPSIYEYDPSLYKDNYYEVGDKVYLKELPTIIFEGYKAIDWYVTTNLGTIEVLKDTEGKYFIMPESEVTINTTYQEIIQEGYNANLYIIWPTTNKLIYYTSYIIDNSAEAYGFYTFFEAPEIDGYTFLYWQDEDGNIYDESNGVSSSEMNGNDRNFTGIYQKINRQMITFRVDGEVYQYQLFDNYDGTKITIPQVILPEGKLLSNWYDNYGGELHLNMGEFGNGETTLYGIPNGTDLIFDAFTYSQDLSVDLTFEFADADSEFPFILNLVTMDEGITIPTDTKIILNNKFFNDEYDISLKVTIYINEENQTIEFKDNISVNENIVTISIPTLEEILNSFQITSTEDLSLSIIISYNFKN